MLTAHWTFTPELVEDRRVLDSMGTGIAMILDEGVEVVPGPAASDKEGALAFDGTCRATVPAAPQLALNQLFGFTVAFFLQVAEPPTGEWRGVLYKPVAEHDARGLGVWMYPDAMRLRAQLFTASGGPEYADSTRQARVGDWMHVALVVDTDTLTLYTDGARDVMVPLEHPVVTPAGDLFLGKDPTGLGFAGRLADLRIYASALSAEAIGSFVES
jgi:Concanavalin A-like lectin/glucanases superfamily